MFPSEWRKRSFSLIKKRQKQNLKNYCPVSLLPICRKIFGRLIKMFGYFLTNTVLPRYQSGLKPGDSCINQFFFFFFFFELEEMENCYLTYKNSVNETRRRLTHENKLFEQEG